MSNEEETRPHPNSPGQDEKGRFLPGNSGFGGRPKGARSKLGEAFLQKLLADFEEHGTLAIETTRTEKPDQYLKVIASILPKEITGEDGEPIQFATEIKLVGIRAPDHG